MKICLDCEGISDTPQERCTACGVRLVDTQRVHFPLRRGEEDAANPLLGTLVGGKYRIHSVLGKGGMGTVFSAVHEVSLVPVALKILNPRYSMRAEYRDYFLGEAQKAGRVTHEHVGRIQDVGESEEGMVYIAMEVVSGVTLHDCIHGEVPLAPALVVEILHQICQALAAAHQAGLVHRDLSTRNVMVIVRKGEPFVKILDFGIAKGTPQMAAAVWAEAGAGPDGFGEPVGFANPPYSAPEHLAGKNVDARADLYSLGVLAYEALSRKFPVRGETAQDLAQATLKGKIEPLEPPPGTPARLRRLVDSLLALSPRERPASAEEVLIELERIRQPGSRLLRDSALLVWVLAIVFLGIVLFLEREPPYLQLRSGYLILAASKDQLEQHQELKSSKLENLSFDFKGFQASDLRVEVEREGLRLKMEAQPIPGPGFYPGILQYSANSTNSASYRSFLAELARHSIGGVPLDLFFVVPGHRPLAVARVLVDDKAPELVLKQYQGDGRQGVLSSQTRLGISCDDNGKVVKLDLLCRDRKDDILIGRVNLLALPIYENLANLLPMEHLGKFVPGPMPFGPVTLVVEAEDQAGNTGRSPALSYEVMDFRAPEPEDKEYQAIVQEGGLRATFHLKLEEKDLKDVRVLREGVRLNSTPEKVEDGLKITLQRPADIPEFVDEAYTIELEDKAGNESQFKPRLRFVSQETQVRFELRGGRSTGNGDSQGRISELGGQLVWDGRPAELSFSCNQAYGPESLRLERDRVRVPDLEGWLVGRHQGGGRIRLGKLADGLYDMTLSLRRESGEPPVDHAQQLRVMASEMELRLPDTSELRFLPGLLKKGIFSQELESLLQQQGFWSLEPHDFRLLKGALWWGTEAADAQARGLKKPEFSGDPFLEPVPLRQGRNLICLELRDVFDRPVKILLGRKPAEELLLGEKKVLARCIARFEYYDSLAEGPTEAIPYEHGQPARLTLRSPYGYEKGDSIKLMLRGSDGPPRELRREGLETILTFDLPSDVLALAANVGPSAEDLKKEGYRFSISPVLQTPAGEKILEKLAVETIRSSLQQTSMGELCAVESKALRAILMIPVLGPTGVFADPVQAGVARRDEFRRRPPIPVKNLRDFYLQRSELTRRQYEDILSGFSSLPAARKPGAKRLLYPGDPLGDQRLERRQMIPEFYRSSEREWKDALLGGPDRAVSGLTFYQAYTATRMAGVLMAGDPEFFRLPFGVELELAALGLEARDQALNGACRLKSEEFLSRYNLATGYMDEPHKWPPTAREAEALGDMVQTDRGKFLGLDFGVREWVLDLPWQKGEAEFTLETWIGDHEVHLGIATSLSEIGRLGSAAAFVEAEGVVRGVALGEPRMLFDVRPGKRVGRIGSIGAGVPGVVQTEYLRRDGRGLLEGRHHPLLRLLGFRLAGGRQLIDRVRSR